MSGGGGGDAVVVGHIAVSCAAAAAASALRRTRNPGALSRRVESRTVSALSVSVVCFVVFIVHDCDRGYFVTSTILKQGEN